MLYNGGELSEEEPCNGARGSMMEDDGCGEWFLILSDHLIDTDLIRDIWVNMRQAF